MSKTAMAVEQKLESNTGNTLLLLGNGFDVDLGFPTKYQDFFKSKQFPFVHNDHSCHPLGHHVYEKGIQDKWYDLENILAEYGSSLVSISNKVDGDKEDYKRIVQGLVDYLNTIDLRQPKEDSVAARILKAADDHLVPPTVYTFNYTDFEAISEAIGISYKNANHVHGSLKDGDIVLGVGDYVKLRSNASFLYKTSCPRYDSRGILSSFELYDTIIFLELSLSKVDYPYFEDFFKDVAYRKYQGEKKKYIRIFTYDEESRLAILDNLRAMNSGLIKLMGYSDFDIIRTKDAIDEDKVQKVIDHLSVRWNVIVGRE